MTAGALGSAAYVVAVVGAAVAAGAALSRFARADALDRAVVGLVAGLGLVVGTAIVLGMVHLLSAFPYLLVTVVAGALAASALTISGRPPRRAPSAWTPSGALALAGGAVLAALATLPTLRGLGAGHTDTQEYHITNLVHWFRSHEIWSLPFQNPGLFTATHPGNGEIATIGLLFATGGDHLIYAVTTVFGVLAVVSVALLARELDGRPDHAALAAVLACATPAVFGTQAHTLATDLAAASGLCAGVALALRALRTREARFLLAAGGAFGLALGSKYTVVVLVPLALLGAAALVRPRSRAPLLVPGVLLFGVPWLVRNWMATGNPIFPETLRLGPLVVFRGGQSPVLAEATPMLHHLVAGHWSAVLRWARYGWELWGPALLLALAGLAAALLRRPRSHRLLLGALALAAWVVYLATPFTGGGPTGALFLALGLRYATPAVLLGVGLAATALPPRLLMALEAGAVAFDALEIVRGISFRPDLRMNEATAVAAAAAAALALAAVAAGDRSHLEVRTHHVAAGLAALAIVTVPLLVHIGHALPTTPLEAALDREGVQRVAVFGVYDMRSVLGRSLADRAVALPGLPDDLGPRLGAELRAAGADALVVRYGSPGVPPSWTPPPGWQHAASTPEGDVFLPAPPSVPPVTSLPSPTPPPPPPSPPAPSPASGLRR